MKKISIPTFISLFPLGRVGVGLLFLFLFFSSCKEIQPVTISGVSNVKLISLTKEGVEFDFDMKINNPNSVSVNVFPSSFDANVNDINAGHVKLTKKTKIKAKGEHTSTFHIKSDFSKLGFGDIAKILPMVSSKSAALSLKGDVKVGKWFYKKKFPIELKKTVSLSK
ncbi:MAG: LEA type 2 family protein [Bacteroidetes bacterium]|nr:LEA type 2 family protein [Bacteroidota bacterium]